MAFCLSLSGSSVNVVTVEQCLLSDNRFTERDPWRARGSREGLGLAGVQGREKAGKESMLKEGRWVETLTLSMPRTDLASSLIWPRAGLLPWMAM